MKGQVRVRCKCGVSFDWNVRCRRPALPFIVRSIRFVARCSHEYGTAFMAVRQKFHCPTDVQRKPENLRGNRKGERFSSGDLSQRGPKNSAWMLTGSPTLTKLNGSSNPGERNAMRFVLTDPSAKGRQASSTVSSRLAAI